MSKAYLNHIMWVPREIILSILERLEKVDLKSSRLVSQLWCACASVHLFEEIYVSSAKDDLEAFEAISQNPLLSNCVRHLRYDATRFIDYLSQKQYLRQLYNQRPLVFDKKTSPAWTTPEPAVNAWVNQVILGDLRSHELMENFRHNQLIKCGHQLYTKHARYQRLMLKSGQFEERLISGLAKLKSLRSVTLEGSWALIRRFEERRTGSYLARHWPRFYCTPQDWCWGAGVPVDKALDGTESYRLLTRALVKASIHLASFAVDSREFMPPGLPPPLFDVGGHNTRLKKRRLNIDVNAFSGLKRFIFRLASYGEEPDEDEATSELFKPTGLPILLRSMETLEHLKLELSNDLCQPPIMYTTNEVLPNGKIWTTLKSLVLVNLSATATQLLDVILHRMPRLHHFGLGGINLHEGSWEGFFEALAQSQHLSSLEFEFDTYLFHHNGADFCADDDETRLSVQEGLEKYVVHGGRNPCLPVDWPDSAAHGYLEEFHPAMQRFVELYSTSKSSSPPRW